MVLKIAVPKEISNNETRVAASPETVKKLIALGASVHIESGAGAGANFTDDAFKDAGAKIEKSAADTYKGAAIVLKVGAPSADEIKMIPKTAVLAGILSPYNNEALLKRLASAKINALAMELVPRITRAQSMDVLSSQSNLAGYKAVLDATEHFGRAMPMMMTAAGTVPPAKVFVMGAGVAGLQAIATAKRLGGVVNATDVRPAAKEQVESLGASFVAVENEEFKEAETAGGYAKQMSKEYQKLQQALVEETIAKQDIVITTALIPGRPAPVLITEKMVKSMAPGSVIVDLAVENGGNCALSEAGKVVVKHGVSIVGHLNVAGRLAANASALYAKNLLTLLTLIIDQDSKSVVLDMEDEILQGIVLTKGGEIVHPNFKDAVKAEKPAAKQAAPAKKTSAKKTTTKAAPKKATTKKATAKKTPSKKAITKKTGK
ncbi:MAG: Re/Si-specific NAD(P)(+) transhydrogenase subunit alpha [Alphaproteobacteria bacterium]